MLYDMKHTKFEIIINIQRCLPVLQKIEKYPLIFEVFLLFQYNNLAW